MKELESSQSRKTYGIPLVYDNALKSITKPMYYPTACKTPLGTIIIATREIIDKEGYVRSMWRPQGTFGAEMDRELMDHYGLYRKECRTIQLVAN
jgi:hypothetical protein